MDKNSPSSANLHIAVTQNYEIAKKIFVDKYQKIEKSTSLLGKIISFFAKRDIFLGPLGSYKNIDFYRDVDSAGIKNIKQSFRRITEYNNPKLSGFYQLDTKYDLDENQAYICLFPQEGGQSIDFVGLGKNEMKKILYNKGSLKYLGNENGRPKFEVQINKETKEIVGLEELKYFIGFREEVPKNRTYPRPTYLYIDDFILKPVSLKKIVYHGRSNEVYHQST